MSSKAGVRPKLLHLLLRQNKANFPVGILAYCGHLQYRWLSFMIDSVPCIHPLQPTFPQPVHSCFQILVEPPCMIIHGMYQNLVLVRSATFSNIARNWVSRCFLFNVAQVAHQMADLFIYFRWLCMVFIDCCPLQLSFIDRYCLLWIVFKSSTRAKWFLCIMRLLAWKRK